METTSEARLGLAVVYSGTSNFVRAFQMEAASAACLGIAVSVYFRCHVYSGTTEHKIMSGCSRWKPLVRPALDPVLDQSFVTFSIFPSKVYIY